MAAPIRKVWNLKGDDVMVLVGKKSKELPLVTYEDLQAIA